MRQDKAAATRRKSVKEDWILWLPPEKMKTFQWAIHPCETAYAMLSITLNEALSMQAQGSLVRANLLIFNTEELLDRMTNPLLALLAGMNSHGRHFGTLSSVAALNPEFYRSETAQRAATWNALLSHVLLNDRSRLFHKLCALSNIVEELAGKYHDAAGQIIESSASEEEQPWATVEILHYDLNTCLREAIVILKCFLQALPESELAALRIEFAKPVPKPVRHARPGILRASS
ncbi:MAG: hypothetical protein ACRD4K_13345 [Candidatus Acidiferrales bacterium]